MSNKNLSKTSHVLGQEAEAIVRDALMCDGYEIRAERYVCRGGEVDLIAFRADRGVVFIEVKARQTNGIMRPEEAMSPQKYKKIRRGVDSYCAENSIAEDACTFDVVCVDTYPNILPKLRHYTNVPLPEAIG